MPSVVFLQALSHTRKHFLGKHLDRLNRKALGHACPFRAHDQVIDAKPAMDRYHLQGCSTL